MRRLTLILSDLYLPEEAARNSAPTELVSLPNFEWLLRFSRGRAWIGDWRLALAARVAPFDLVALAPAHVVARDRVPREQAASSWFATPVRLEARIDHVRLADRGLLRLSADERAAWCAEFLRAFGPDYALHDLGPRGFLLSGLPLANVATIDPARLLGSDVGSAVPRGAECAPLRRLAAEIEMWMHGAQLNRTRERAGLPAISALWLWGGGAPPEMPAPGGHPPGSVAFAGADPYLAALARARTGADPHPVSGGLTAFQPDADHGVIELAPMCEPAQSLASIDEHWFGPAREALSRGALEVVGIIVNDRSFQVQRRAGWRFWRRNHPWLEMLRHRAPGTKA